MADEVIVKMRADIDDVVRELNKVKGQFGDIEKKASSIEGVFKKVGNQILAAFSVGALIGFGKQVLQVTGEFQKLEAVLTNTLGSKGQAQGVLRDIKKFASETNFGVKELTESYVKLANQGFKPTVEQLRKLADLANSTGKSFDQLTEAIIDAQTGEFERLKEFGIRAEKQGDKVQFAFKGVQTQVDFTNDSIRNYILSLGELEGVMGSTEAISKTLTGQISNLGDAWDNWLNSLGQNSEGIFSTVIASMTKLLDLATRFNEGLESNSSTLVKVAGTQVEILKFQQDTIDKNLEMILDIEKASIDAIKQANEDKAVADGKATANYQKSIAKRIELNKISLELVYKDYNDKLLAGQLEDKAEKEFHLRQIYRYEQEREFLQNELPKALSKYRDETVKNIKVKDTEIKKVEKVISAYDELIKKVGDAEKKIKDNAAKGIFNEKDIDNVTALKEELRKVNDEIALQTYFFEKQADIATMSKVEPLGVGGAKEKEARPIAGGNYNPVNPNRPLTKDEKAQIIDTAQELGNTLESLSQQLSDQRIQSLQEAATKEQAILEEQLKNKGITEKQYQEKVLALNKRTAEEIRKERIKQFNIDKALAIANITIDTAQGIAKAVALGPASAFVIPLLAGIGAAQLALVASQQPPKYEKGGKLKGPRHRDGGILIEAEGGEYIAPIHAANKYFPELEAMKNNTFDKLMERKYLAPALKKQKEQYEQGLAANLWKSMQVHASLNDDNLLGSDRLTRKVLYELIAVTKENKTNNNIRFRNV